MSNKFEINRIIYQKNYKNNLTCEILLLCVTKDGATLEIKGEKKSTKTHILGNTYNKNARKHVENALPMFMR